MRNFLYLLWVVLFLFNSEAAANDSPPVATFFARAKLQSGKVSPSGQWLAIIAGAGTGRLVLAVVDTEGKAPPQVTASFSNADATSFDWVGDDHLVFSVGDLLVGPGQERFGGLYSIKRDGTQQRQLFRGGRYHGEALIDVPRGGGDVSVLVANGIVDLKGELDSVDAYRIDVTNGRRDLLSLDRPAHVKRWLFSPTGEPRVAIASNEGVSTIYWRGAKDKTWRQIASFPSLQMVLSPPQSMPTTRST